MGPAFRIWLPSFSHYNLEPHSSPTALEPVLAYLDHPFASWASWSQSLLVLDGSKIGRTASNPFSSPRSETLPTLVLDWPECYSFTHFRCPLTPDPAEITREHFASCIEPLILLAHQAMPLSTFLRAEIWHEFCGNYFLSEFTHFIPLFQSYVPPQGMHTVWKHKHSNVFAGKTAILESQSEARDLFCFLGCHWLHRFVRFHNHRTSNISEQVMKNPAAEPTASPVPNQAGFRSKPFG